jgi:hypothetical protein
MCWNADISINTFLFSFFTLLFIYFTNTFTKYKILLFNNKLIYLFLFLVALMQLIEYFLWKNLYSSKLNKIFSFITFLIIFLQQLTLILAIDNSAYKNNILYIYLISLLILIIYKSLINPFIFKTTVSPSGHLAWKWSNFNGYESIILYYFLLFYFIPSLLIKNINLLFFIAGITLFFAILLFKKEYSYGSIWCFYTNTIFLIFLIDILIIKPFYEYNGLCLQNLHL